MRSIEWLVVHSAAAYDPKAKRIVHQTVDQIRDYHIRHNGWKDIGYHAYIEQDGTILPGRDEQDWGSHVAGFNGQSLGICVSGHGDYADFNPEQRASLVLRLTRWCRHYGLSADHCIGHREADEHGAPRVLKTCPGTLVDMDNIRQLVREKLAVPA